jgi:uncharacterized protein (TIGR03435 family)
MLRAICAVALAWTVSSPALQQTTEPADASSTFEVTSVKRNVGGGSTVSVGPTPGGYAAINVPLRLLITLAFEYRPGQVTGGPDWITVDRFDVVARAPAGAAAPTMPSRLRQLLRERFKLVTHVESREQPIYALVRSRPNGPGSPHLKPSTIECAPRGAAANPCRVGGTIGSASGSVKATGQTMVDFAAYLGNNVDRIVADRTGLSGRFDFELAWTADDVRGLTTEPRADDRGPERGSLFTALQENLGLKLEPARGEVPFLVIDSVERPTAD